MAKKEKLRCFLHRSLIILMFAGVLISGTVRAEVKTFPVRGCTITMEVTLPVSPETAFDLMTGDISGWWDHFLNERLKPYVEAGKYKK